MKEQKSAKSSGGSSRKSSGPSHEEQKSRAYERGQKHGRQIKRAFHSGVAAGKGHLDRWKNRRMGINKAIAHAHREAPHTFKRGNQRSSSARRVRRKAKRAAKKKVEAAERQARKAAKKAAKRAEAATPKEALIQEAETQFAPAEGMVNAAKDFDADFDAHAAEFPVQDHIVDAPIDSHFDDDDE